MSIQPPPQISPAPLPAAIRGQKATFSDRIDALVTWWQTSPAQLGALASNIWSNATETYTSAMAAVQAAADAASSAIAASSAANATKWVSGANYADGAVVWSLLDRLPYRRIGAGSGTTDPKLDGANWAIQIFSLGMGGMSLTGNISLTTTSPAAVTVIPSTPGLYAYLPDATTCQKGVSLFAFYNAGSVDYGVKDFTGTVIGWVRPGTTATIGLTANPTSAGVWIPGNVQKLGVTAALNVASVSGTTLRRVAIDANRSLFLFGALYAVVYDASTQTWGSPTLVRSIPNGVMSAAALAGTDKVLVASCDGTTGLQTVVLSITGTSISAGAATSASAGGNVNVFGELVAVGSGFAFAYSSSSFAYLRAVTVSGTGSTIGAEVVFGSVPTLVSLFVLGSVLRALGQSGTGSNVTVQPYTLSGTTLTPGTSASQSATIGSYRAFQNAAGNLVVIHDLSGSVNVSVFKLSGTIEASTTAQLFSVASTASSVDYVQITASKTAIVGLGNSPSAVIWNIHVDTAGTSSCGTADSFSVSGASVCALGASGNIARFVFSVGGDNVAPTQLQFDCAGTSPVRAASQSRFGINVPAKGSFGKDGRSPALLSAGSNQYSIGGNRTSDGCFNLAGIQALPPLGESFAAGAVGASQSEGWLLAGLNSSGTSLGTTIKRVEAAA